MELRPTTRGLAIAAALVMLLAGCGDDGGDDVSARETTEATDAPEPTEAADDDEPTESSTEADDDTGSTTTTTVAAEPELTEEEALAQAESVNLVIGDFAAYGELWMAEVEGPDDEEDDDLDECLGGSDVPDELVETDTTTFSNDPGDGSVQVLSNVSVVMPTEDDAVAAMEEAATDLFRTCMEEDFVDGEEDSTAALNTVPDGGQFTEQTVALVGEVTFVTDGGTPVSGFIDLHLLRTGSVISLVTFLDIDGAGAQELLTGLLNTITERHAELG